ncbi:probable peptidylglycine alpha-hydroxylating monooxygenase 1 [Lingula anatina]|uniref:peptidylglycine monooxygenase n=1 Tax=Lingula anatina TaxID=7574 RepID=A0A1S3H7I0_LINAN|nr:probable peptidylglycine alpha-hydroxylating monooxygenase 1 [Lingula anatina]|eukprot:XP_013381446.1 probable peptidylglycine alpha-hydroxylating monooxygenase 1 [Lingula anatina]
MFNLLIFVFTLFALSSAETDRYDVTLKIPNKAFDGEIWMACTTTTLKDVKQFVTNFQPVANPGIVHHMSIHVCEKPFSTDPYWACVDKNRVCGPSGRLPLFEWGRDAPGWKIPEGYGIPVDRDHLHVVLQIHMKEDIKASATGPLDFSGLRVSLRTTQPQYEIAMGVLGNVGYVPAKTGAATTDSACKWPLPMTVPLAAYSLHTHNLGRAVSAYIIRNGEWIEIGRGDPGYPEMVMDIADRGLTIRPGDILAARCTFDNDQDHDVKFGSEHGGEMCNVYLHYGVSSDTPAHQRMLQCSTNAQKFHWDTYFESTPADASDPNGDTDQARMVKRLGLVKVPY